MLARIFLFFIVVQPNALLASHACRVMHLGKPSYEYSTKIDEISEDKKFFFLGEGVSGKAYLEKNSDGFLRVRKIYNSGATGERRHFEDSKGFEILNKILLAIDSFKIPHVESFATKPDYTNEIPATLGHYSSYVQGRSLHDILLDTKVDEGLKSLLRAEYLRKIEVLRDELQRLDIATEIIITDAIPNHFQDRQLDSLPILKARLKEQNVKLLIKSDNIIIDPYQAKTMTLIDPY